MIINSQKIIFLIVFSLLLCGVKYPEEHKIYFINNDSIEILKGKVKHYELSGNRVPDDPNLGEDYSIVDINENGDVTKIVTGFHGNTFNTYYNTIYGADGKKYRPKAF